MVWKLHQCQWCCCCSDYDNDSLCATPCFPRADWAPSTAQAQSECFLNEWNISGHSWMNEPGLKTHRPVIGDNLEMKCKSTTWRRWAFREAGVKSTSSQRWGTVVFREGASWRLRGDDYVDTSYTQVAGKPLHGGVGEGPCWLQGPCVSLSSTVRSTRPWQTSVEIPALLVKCSVKYLNQNFSTWTLLTFGLGNRCGGCPVYCRILNKILGLHPFGHSTSLPSCGNCTHLRSTTSS